MDSYPALEANTQAPASHVADTQGVNGQQLDLYVNTELSVSVSLGEWQRWFEGWLEAMQVSGPCELTVTLTDDERMQGLNRQYRDRDSTTDVLAFAAQEAGIPGQREDCPLVLGDIMISVPTAQRQADEQQHSLTEELAVGLSAPKS